MNLVVISDTHGMHHEMAELPEGDVLIHCGDFSNVGEREEVIDFLRWFSEHPHKHKIFIAGNHDRSFDPKFHRSKKDKYWLDYALGKVEDLGLVYLEGTGVTIDGVNFWGSPITPDFYPQHWAFNRNSKLIEQHWNTIPDNTDVLITHGPCAHVLDWCVNGDLAGCPSLSYHIQRVNPMYHFFGHIHESYGVEQHVGTVYANASQLNHRYNMVNKPLEFQINNDSNLVV